MPSIQQNQKLWGERYGWPDAGEEWSEAWGGAESQWFGTLFPRIHTFVPTQTILEIAPGFGRWTQYLQGHCNRLIAVDLSQRCVDECRRRFQALGNVQFHVNDGTSLVMVPDGSVDFAFSFDSLVHAEIDVIAAYLRQLATKLRPDGVGFIHHSNLAAYVDPSTGSLPAWLDNRAWRAQTMGAKAFRNQCESAGLLCVGQEIVNWRVNVLSDCFSVFTLPGSRWARPNRVLINHRFMEEANSLSRMTQLYTGLSFDRAHAARAAVVHLFKRVKQTSRIKGLIRSALSSAKGLSFVRRWYQWVKQRLPSGPGA